MKIIALIIYFFGIHLNAYANNTVPPSYKSRTTYFTDGSDLFLKLTAAYDKTKGSEAGVLLEVCTRDIAADLLADSTEELSSSHTELERSATNCKILVPSSKNWRRMASRSGRGPMRYFIERTGKVILTTTAGAFVGSILGALTGGVLGECLNGILGPKYCRWCDPEEDIDMRARGCTQNHRGSEGAFFGAILGFLGGAVEGAREGFSASGPSPEDALLVQMWDYVHQSPKNSTEHSSQATPLSKLSGNPGVNIQGIVARIKMIYANLPKTSA